VRLAVATDGFQPFDVNDAPYSCWPIFVTPLNLPPGFFNVMQHLIIHLPYEARLGGPVLARRCYPYER